MSTPGRVVLLHGVSSSVNTWWRTEMDLQDLGLDVRSFNLVGHGGRPAHGRPLSLQRMSDDVVDQLAEQRADLVVGHSLGALVACLVAKDHPELVGRVVLEDPPALGPDLDPADVAAEIERETERAVADPVRMAQELLEGHPLWTQVDAANDVASLRCLDVEAVTDWLRSERWDLAAMVRACPVPLHLLIATGAGAAVTEPTRAELLRYLDSDHVTRVNSSHRIHRDRPGILLATVLDQLRAATR